LIDKEFGMKYTLGFRVWHWLNAIVVFGLLGTVFLRKTFLSWRTNSEIIISQLSSFDIDITQEQAKILAKAIRVGMWEWHIILGYMLAGLILFRIYLFFKDNSKLDRFSDLDMHKKAVRALYILFYVVLFFMGVSGLVIHFYAELGILKERAHDIKEVHETIYPFIGVFVALHIAGVTIAENTKEKGIVSTMINGKE